VSKQTCAIGKLTVPISINWVKSATLNLSQKLEPEGNNVEIKICSGFFVSNLFWG